MESPASRAAQPLLGAEDAVYALYDNETGDSCMQTHGAETRKRRSLSRRPQLSGVKQTKPQDFDGLDFEDVISPVAEAHLRAKSARDHRVTAAVRWVLNAMIGITVALLGVAIIYSTRKLTEFKFDVVYGLVDSERRGTVLPGVAFLTFLSFNCFYALLASLPVAFIEPLAGGSGIPEIKLVLNGVKVPRVTRLRTLFVKVVGNIFSVSSGLPVGYEGPMIHIGGAVGAGISQGKSSTLGWDTRWSVWEDFRNDREKRDFIVCGAGAGVASAFNAPIGGVLFAYEESASHWHKSLTWRAFFASITAAYTIDFILSGLNDGGQLGRLTGDAMMNFGAFTAPSADGSSTSSSFASWGIWELPLYLLLGIAGGLVGATFNAANGRVTSLRLKYFKNVANGGSAGCSRRPKDSAIPSLATTATDATRTDAPFTGASQASADHATHNVVAIDGAGTSQRPRSRCERVMEAPSRSWQRLKPQTRALSLRVIEVVGLAFIVSTIAFFAPLFFGTCLPRPMMPAHGSPSPSPNPAWGHRPTHVAVSVWLPEKASDHEDQDSSHRSSSSRSSTNSTTVASPGNMVHHTSDEVAALREGQPRAHVGGQQSIHRGDRVVTGGDVALHNSLRQHSRSAVSAAAEVARGGGSWWWRHHVGDESSGYNTGTLVSFYCPADEFNDLASFWFAPSEEAIRLLFHFSSGSGMGSPTPSPSPTPLPPVATTAPALPAGLKDSATASTESPAAAAFALSHLAFFFFVYTTLMCITSGVAIPSGLFIPTLLSGAALGRLAGESVNSLIPPGTWASSSSPSGVTVDPGMYALIGSAAMLGGTTRMTISLAVILLECTGNLSYGLPLMVTLMAARWTGNLFNEGIYDTQIRLRDWPLLEERVDKAIAYEMRAADVMTPRPLVFAEVERVGRVADVLNSCSHNGFPVVYTEEMMRMHPRLGNMAGYIQRRHLAVLLAHRAFHAALPGAGTLRGSISGSGNISAFGSSAALQQLPEQLTPTPRSVAAPSLQLAPIAASRNGRSPLRSRSPPGSGAAASAAFPYAHSDVSGGNVAAAGGSALLTPPPAAAPPSIPMYSASTSQSTSAHLERSHSEVRLRLPSVSVGGMTAAAASGYSGRAPAGSSGSDNGLRVGSADMLKWGGGDTLTNTWGGHAGTSTAIVEEDDGEGEGDDETRETGRGVGGGRAGTEAGLKPQQIFVRVGRLDSDTITAPARAVDAVDGLPLGPPVPASFYRGESAESSIATAVAIGLPSPDVERGDATVSNSGAITAARTGRSTAQYRSIRMAAPPAAAAPAASAFANASSNASLAIVQQQRQQQQQQQQPVHVASAVVPASDEPASSAALYAAIFSTEFRYAEEPLLEASDFDAAYPRFPDVTSINLSAREREMWIDLRPYMDPTPICVHVHTPLARTFRLFRSLGLRHLIVLNNSQDVVGVVTRHELTESALHERLVAVRAADAAAAEAAAHAVLAAEREVLADRGEAALGATRPGVRL